MLTIRSEQLRALGRVAAEGFEDRMVEHAAAFAPRLFLLRGPVPMRRLVRQGIERARLHGFDLRGPVRFWIEMMMAHGSLWHDDPQLACVHRHLARSDLQQNFRADLVYESLLEYVEHVEGPDKVQARGALQGISAADWSELLKPAADPSARARALLQTLNPTKVDVVGDDAIQRVVAAAGQACRLLSIDPAEGQVLLSGLMFGFGHGVLEDPLYPWVASTLRPGPSGTLRCRRLARKTRVYVRAVLAHWAV